MSIECSNKFNQNLSKRLVVKLCVCGFALSQIRHSNLIGEGIRKQVVIPVSVKKHSSGENRREDELSERQSGAGLHFLPLDCMAKANIKGVFLFADTGRKAPACSGAVLRSRLRFRSVRWLFGGDRLSPTMRFTAKCVRNSLLRNVDSLLRNFEFLRLRFGRISERARDLDPK